MTCPNKLPGINGNCDGRRWIMHRNQPVPCPSCWRKAGKRSLTMRQTAALRRFHVTLTIVSQGSLFVTDEDAAAYEDAHAQLEQLGVTQQLRNEWLGWLAREGAPEIEVHT